MKKILLIGHAGFYNRGCEAIVRSTVDIIKKAMPDSSIVLTSRDPELDCAKVKEDSIQINRVIPWNPKCSPRFSAKWAWQQLHRKVCYPDFPSRDYLRRDEYRRANIVILIGGDNLSDDYGGPRKYFDTLRVAKKCGAKTIIWGASVGPFRPINMERTWSSRLREVDLITVREDKTLEYLHHIGIDQNVRRVSDPAFLLPAVKPRESIPHDEAARMTVGIGASDLMRRYGVMEQCVNALVGLVEYLLSHYAAEIMFVPHVIHATQSDVFACEEVVRRLSDNHRCYILPSSLNASEMKHYIALCDFFIGARTHSTIASLSSLVPTISIGYSVKAWGINHDLLGSDDYVIDVQSISTEVLVKKFEQLREKREEIVCRLQVSVPKAQESARRAEQYLKSLLKGSNGCCL